MARPTLKQSLKDVMMSFKVALNAMTTLTAVSSASTAIISYRATMWCKSAALAVIRTALATADVAMLRKGVWNVCQTTFY